MSAAVHEKLMYCLYRKGPGNSPKMFVLADDRGNPLVSAYYSELEEALFLHCKINKIFAVEIVYVEFLMREP